MRNFMFCVKNSKLLLPTLFLLALSVVILMWHSCFRSNLRDNSAQLLNWVVKHRPRRDFSDSNNVTGYSDYIVPNIVHFIRFDELEIKFYEMLTIKAVHRNHSPDKIYIHCDPCQFTGRYWDQIKSIPILEVRPMPKPTHIYGKVLSHVWHASDIARLLIMMTYGGIFLDNDCYVVQSLDKFRHFEFAIGWSENEYLGTQVLVAHRDARFLEKWYETYRFYRPDLWYYNAGELPTTSVLYKHPELVHRVKVAFGVTDLSEMLYNNRTQEWHNFYVIHLMVRHRWYKFPQDSHRIREFDENNVLDYDRTFGEMARSLLHPEEIKSA